MSSNKRTIYLGLDYTDFTGGVTEVNRKMSLLDAEFKLATEQAKNYGTETDKLGLKHDYLTQKIKLQNDKVEEAKKAYDKALEGNKATQKEIDNLNKRLLQERTTLERLNGSLIDTDREMQELNESTNETTSKTKSFGDTIRGVAKSLGMDDIPAVESLAKKFDGVSESVGKAIVGVAAIATALFGCSKQIMSTADDILTLSAKTGIATDELQKLQYASELVDVDVETMTSSIQKLTRSMDDARNGSDEYAKAFERLKVHYKNVATGELKDANKVFYDVIDALGKVKNETERNALSMTIFGKSASELNPLIKAGSKTLKELGIEAEDLGRVLSEDTLIQAGKADDSMVKFNETIKSLKLSLGVTLLPVLTSFFDLISGIPTPVLVGIGVFVLLATIFTKVAFAVRSVAIANATLAATNALVGETGAVAAAGMSPLLIVLLLIAAAIALIVGGVVAVKSGLNSVKSTVADTTKSLNTGIEESKIATAAAGNTISTTQYHASGTRAFKGGKTWVGEAGPEIVDLPRGSRIYNNEESERMSSGDVFNITVIANANEIDEVQKVIQMAKAQQQAYRRGVIPT